jgi:urease accessory protein
LLVDEHSSTDPGVNAWLAHLSLAFVGSDNHTRLRFRHQGPLRIQKALYPEGGRCCHAVVVHPPGGIASGDRLCLQIDVDANSHAVVMTPSATKWYGAFDGAPARQTLVIRLDGKLEWLPAETIVFDAARVVSDIQIDASVAASMIGWDLLVFGRHGSGERFRQGQFLQTLRVGFGGDPIWTDRLVLAGDDPLFDSPIGFDGHHAVATFWAIAPENDSFGDALIDGLREAVPVMAFTRLHPRLVVGRQVGDPIDLDAVLKRARAWVRQYGWSSPAADLRLWAT